MQSQHNVFGRQDLLLPFPVLDQSAQQLQDAFEHFFLFGLLWLHWQGLEDSLDHAVERLR